MSIPLRRETATMSLPFISPTVLTDFEASIRTASGKAGGKNSNTREQGMKGHRKWDLFKIMMS